MSAVAGVVTALMVVSLGVLGLSAVLVTIRMLRGPSALDRLVAVDVIVAELMCGLAVYAALTQDSSLVPVIVATSLVGFLGSTTVGRFMGRGDRS